MNHRVLMVAVYLFLISAFLVAQPDITFGREGRIRPFGTQDKESTVFPLWWWVFVLAVISYCITIALMGWKV